MSEIDFDRVSGRFIMDLARMQPHVPNRGTDGRMILVIRSMKWLRIKFEPDMVWDRTCIFLNSLIKFATRASGQQVKYAFHTLLKELLIPIAGNATTELSTPRWSSIIDSFTSKLTLMLTKPKHWQNTFPALAVALCASPQEAFSSHWLGLVL